VLGNSFGNYSNCDPAYVRPSSAATSSNCAGEIFSSRCATATLQRLHYSVSKLRLCCRRLAEEAETPAKSCRPRRERTWSILYRRRPSAVPNLEQRWGPPRPSLYGLPARARSLLLLCPSPFCLLRRWRVRIRALSGRYRRMGSPNSPTEMDSECMRSGYTLEQMNRYRNGATEAANLALPCKDAELRDAYLSIARTWTELADKLERELRAKQGKRSA
jgi:hypothetical protein